MLPLGSVVVRYYELIRSNPTSAPVRVWLPASQWGSYRVSSSPRISYIDLEVERSASALESTEIKVVIEVDCWTQIHREERLIAVVLPAGYCASDEHLILENGRLHIACWHYGVLQCCN